MTISGLGVRTPDLTSARVEHGYLERDKGTKGVRRSSVSDRLLGAAVVGGTGVLALGGGLLMRANGMGRPGTVLAAIGGAILGASLLGACTPGGSGRSKRTDVPGDEGAPGDDVSLHPESARDLTGADRTNPAPDGYDPKNSAARDAREGVVQLVHSTGMGSGWVVEPGRIVTNYHVAQGYEDVDVIDHRGETHAGQVVRLDRRHDLALVEAPTLKDAPLGMDDVVEQHETGETTGYPNGEFSNDAAVAAGMIDVNDDGMRREALFLSGTSAPGVSGGAVINGAGEVMGTAFAVGDAGDSEFVLAIPNDQVQRLLDRHERGSDAGGGAPATAG